MSKNGGLGKFLCGIGIGVGLGVLFAPKSGAETRAELKVKFDELVKKIKEIDVKEVKENLVSKVEEIKKEISELDKEKVAAIAKEKAEAIKIKLDELMDEAKEKATPVIQKTISDLRKKTIDFLNNTVDKLEAAENSSKKIKEAK